MVLKDIFSYLEGSCKENILEEKMIGLAECLLNRLFVTERTLKLLSPVKMVFHRIYNKIEYLQKAENMDKISDLPYNF